MILGYGIFMWNAPERRSRRYGMFYMSKSNYDGDVQCVPTFDLDLATSLVGKKVKLSCRVVETRTSGHAGDEYLGFLPSTPEIGAIIELGVGPCYLESDLHSPYGFTVGIQPTDNRPKFWLEPRRWFELHDQTVELLIEETTEDESPVPVITQVIAENVVISNGDGTFQFVGNQSSVLIKPTFEKIDDGFIVTPPYAMGNKGQTFEIE